MSFKEEQNGKFIFPHKELIKPENSFEKELKQMRTEKDSEELQKKLLEAEKQTQKELEQKIENGLELLPLGNKLVMLPYPRNPYRKIIDGSIIVEYNGEFWNPDSGENDTMKELVACAKIIEVGPDCKYLKVGDDVFYDTRTTYPIPFMKQGYILTSEPQILCVMNNKLKERFGMNN